MPELRRFHAPGRVNLLGEHTDYSGGLVLPAAIDRGITLDVELGGGTIALVSDRAEEPVEVPADGSAPPEQGWGRYVAAVAAELAALGRPPVGLRGSVTSDLPQGSGLSSSAALEVVLALALSAAAGVELDALELAGAAQRAELRAVGVPCGIMDQAASLLGVEQHAIRLDCGSLDWRPVPIPDGVALVLVDSGPRTLEGSGYARRRTELEAGIAALRGGPAALRGGDAAAAHAAVIAGGGDEVAARRVRHVVSENARVDAVVAALEAGDMAALGPLLAAGHASLRDDFEVSTPELDLLVDLAVGAGALGARMTGGGFGGAIVALVEVDRADALARSVVGAYRDRSGRPGSALVTRPAQGAGERPAPVG